MNETPCEAAERPDAWKLQDANARFSELVRLAGEAGPQRITVNGKEKAFAVASNCSVTPSVALN